MKCVRQQEVVIGGYTEPEGSRVGIGALLTGVFEDGQLVYVGKVGTGFSSQTLQDLKKRLAALPRPTCPFATPPRGVARAHWVEPRLVAEVTFSEWTADGKMRHPSFQGLREDKPADQVVRERPADGGDRPDEASPSPRPAASAPASRGPGAPRGGEAKVAGVRLTHPERVLYPPAGTTKRDLALFYESIAGWILPHLKDRPTSLVRCPEGVAGTCFYQKHAGPGVPATIRRVKIREKTKAADYLVVDDLPALIGLVQIGILEIHTWNARVADLERPDRVVFDLDPAPDVDWGRVVAAARLVRARLQARRLESFVKTTGGKGLHVVVPLAPGATWAETAVFSREVAEDIVREHPEGYVARMAKSERTGKIFIDTLRNVRGATSIAAYSTRARPSAPISVPLDWDELSPRLRSDHYTIASLPRRLAGLRADPWSRYGSVRQALP